MPETKWNTNDGDGVVADDLNCDIPEHERAKAKSLIMKFATFGEEIECVNLDGCDESGCHANQEEEQSNELYYSA